MTEVRQVSKYAKKQQRRRAKGDGNGNDHHAEYRSTVEHNIAFQFDRGLITLTQAINLAEDAKQPEVAAAYRAELNPLTEKALIAALRGESQRRAH